MMDSEMWGPIHEIGQIKNKIYSRCTVIDSRGSNCYKQMPVYINELLKKCLEGVEGVSTDTIHLGDLGFVIFVLARH